MLFNLLRRYKEVNKRGSYQLGAKKLCTYCYFQKLVKEVFYLTAVKPFGVDLIIDFNKT